MSFGFLFIDSTQNVIKNSMRVFTDLGLFQVVNVMCQQCTVSVDSVGCTYLFLKSSAASFALSILR
jgi:hypothetical protein